MAGIDGPPRGSPGREGTCHGRLPRLPEILAPGGDILSVRAAIDAGADAVYLGLSRFNARRKAANITERDLPELVLLAHERGARIYVTANIILTEEEIPAYVDFVSHCLETGVDGFIVADLGALPLIPLLFPGTELHASTQMTTHTSAQISFLRSFGISRVNLCRELSLEAIADLTAHAHAIGMETEVFVHGAYCVSFSGQCLMSSYLGGESGNRGICFQPCRRRYAVGGGVPRNLLSLKDNNAICIAPELARTGVDSLKIEGRMKNFQYVHTVVSAWRGRLDRLGREEEDKETYDELSGVFNRGFSVGYAKDRVGREMFVDSPFDRSYREAGRVCAYRSDTGVLTALCRPIEPGTRLLICTEDNLIVCAALVEESLPPDPEAGADRSRMRIRIENELKGKILPGQVVLSGENRVETEGLEERLLSMKPRKIPLHAELSGSSGSPLVLTLRREPPLAPGHGIERHGPGDGEARKADAQGAPGPRLARVERVVPLAPALKAPHTPASVAAQIGRLGDTPFELVSCVFSDLEPGLFLPVKELNAMRRRAVELLGFGGERAARTTGAAGGGDAAGPLPEAFPGAPPIGKRRRAAAETPGAAGAAGAERRTGTDGTADARRKSCLALLFNDPAEAEEFRDSGAEILIEAGNPGDFLQGTGAIPWLPVVTREEDIGAWQRLLERSDGPCVAGNTGIGFLAGSAGIPWIVGPSQNCANSWALRAAAERGAVGAVLSPELSRDQIAVIRAPDRFGVWLTVMGPILLMTTRQCLFRGREG